MLQYDCVLHAPRLRSASSQSCSCLLRIACQSVPRTSITLRFISVVGSSPILVPRCRPECKHSVNIWERVHAILACTQKIPWSLKETREDDLSRVTTSNSSMPHGHGPHRVLICTPCYKGHTLCKLTVLVSLCSPATLRSHLPSASIHPSQHRRQTDMGLLCKIFTNVLSPSSRIHI